MDDLILEAQIDAYTKLIISPIAPETYSEYVDDDTVGGPDGYFVLKAAERGPGPHLEVLAKVCSVEAAERLLDLILSRGKVAA